MNFVIICLQANLFKRMKMKTSIEIYVKILLELSNQSEKGVGLFLEDIWFISVDNLMH